MKRYIQIAIRTRSNTTDWKVGERLIDSFGIGDGLLMPEYASYFNPDKIKDPFLGKAACEAIWAVKCAIHLPGPGGLRDFFADFAWRRKKMLKCTGYVVHTSKNIYLNTVPGNLSFNSVYSEKIDWYSLFKIWCEIFPPQLGMLHIFTKPELEFKVNEYDSFQIGSFNAALKPDIPNAAWAMVYGDEFAEKVDVDRIVSAGFPIEKLGNAYLVRVTENIQDVLNDFPRFSKRRAELKSLFPENFFLIKEEPVIGASE
jgi:hypothetical protein